MKKEIKAIETCTLYGDTSICPLCSQTFSLGDIKLIIGSNSKPMSNYKWIHANCAIDKHWNMEDEIIRAVNKCRTKRGPTPPENPKEELITRKEFETFKKEISNQFEKLEEIAREQQDDSEEDDIIMEMANLYARDTGIKKGRVYASQKQGSHGPRIKYFPHPRENKSISISISDEPEILVESSGLNIPQKTIKQLYEFVRINKAILLKYWKDNTMSTRDFLESLKQIS